MFYQEILWLFTFAVSVETFEKDLESGNQAGTPISNIAKKILLCFYEIKSSAFVFNDFQSISRYFICEGVWKATYKQFHLKFPEFIEFL